MTNFVRAALLAFLTAFFTVGAAQAEQIYFLTDLPAKHPPFINKGWDKPIQWLNDLGSPPVDCMASDSDLYSQCLFAVDVPATVPAGATRVMIRVKAVAQLPTAPATGQEKDVLVLAHAFNPVNGENGNHLIHCETWGDGSNGQQIRRRVCYTEAWLPIIDGKVYLRAGKRILVGGFASITVTIEGYFK